MFVTITHHGVPVGTSDLQFGDPIAVGIVDPLPGYVSVEATVRIASAKLANLGFFPPTQGELLSRDALAQAGTDAATAFARAGALQFNLLDAIGVEVPTDFVNLIERSVDPQEVVALVRFRDGGARVPARSPRPVRQEGSASRPHA